MSAFPPSGKTITTFLLILMKYLAGKFITIIEFGPGLFTFARKTWTSQDDINHLMQILAIKRLNIGHPQTSEIDEKTWSAVKAIFLQKEEELRVENDHDFEMTI